MKKQLKEDEAVIYESLWVLLSLNFVENLLIIDHVKEVFNLAKKMTHIERISYAEMFL